MGLFFEKFFYTLLGVVLGSTIAASFFVYRNQVADDDALVEATSTATPAVTRTVTRTPTKTVTPTATPVSKYRIGDAVVLTAGNGACLQSFDKPTFAGKKLQCYEQGTPATLAAGPERVKDDAGTYTWWLLEEGGYTIENWMKPAP